MMDVRVLRSQPSAEDFLSAYRQAVGILWMCMP